MTSVLTVHLAVNPPYQYTIWSKFIFIPLFPKYMTPGHQGFQRSHETRSPAVTLLKIFKLVLSTYCTKNRKSALDKHLSKQLKGMKRVLVVQQLLTRILYSNRLDLIHILILTKRRWEICGQKVRNQNYSLSLSSH